MKRLNFDRMAPHAPETPHILKTHGDIRIDPFYWMRDKTDLRLVAWLEEENQYREKVMASTKSFEGQLYNEIINRFDPNDRSVEIRDNGYWYWNVFEEGNEYPVYYRRADLPDAQDEVLFDVNQMAAGKAYYHLATKAVSPDNQWVAYAEDTLSRRIYTIRFRHLTTNNTLDECVPGTSGQIVWAADNKSIFYVVRDETLRPYRVYRHQLGSDVSEDTLVYEEKDLTFHLTISKSRSKDFIFIHADQTVSSETYIIPAKEPSSTPISFLPRERDLEYHIDHYEGLFYIRTNYQAKNFQLATTDSPENAKSTWSTIIAGRDNILLENFLVFREFILVEERIDGILNIRVVPLGQDLNNHYVDFGEDAYVASIGPNPDPLASEVLLEYASMTTPKSTFKYNIQLRTLEIAKEEVVKGNFDKRNYRSERLFAYASDGTRIPISIVYHKNYVKNGNCPLLLYGYGSYGISLDPSFSIPRLSLLDRGFAFAIAHIRGGQELGRHWYDQGRMEHKMNTFTDFISCAEYLIAARYTSPAKLYAMGGSAGGLLVGAVMNMRPDLFNGIVAAVPFVDVVTTMLDDTIPLTTGEYDEWGNPNEPIAYFRMKQYSPYDNIKSQEYPHLFVTTGLHDSQVQYWEPAKWVAKLRKYKTDSNLVLLYCDMDAGHGGASGRFKRHKETAMIYTFLLALAGKVNE